MAEPVLGIYFSVWTHQRCSLDDLAPIVAQATGCALSQSTERGIAGDYVGESFGMRIELLVSPKNPPPPRNETRFSLMGGPEFDEGIHVAWTDISGYVAQFLTQQTGLMWNWSGSTVSDAARSPSP
jgi:hypothetical protein